jgi:SAM-dependent methyltransferase
MRPGSSRIAEYYDWLSRYHGLVAALGHKGGFDPWTVHRQLRPDRPGTMPADVVHERVIAALGRVEAPHVIDAGCGFGGTIFYMHARLGGEYDGLTLSPVQQSRATREARRRGLSGSCRFHVHNYDDDLRRIVPSGADVIVAIESLAHSTDPARSIAHLAAALRPGGRLAIVDDVPRDAVAEADPDLAAFRAGWSCPAILGDEALAAAVAGAHLWLERDEDLTPLVTERPEERLDRLVRINRRLRRLAGGTRVGSLIDSLYGGLMLERLYRRGLMRYRLVVARPA